MKLLIKIILLLLLPAFVKAQPKSYWEDWNNKQLDSLRVIWKNTNNDTLRMAAARSLGGFFQESKADSVLFFLKQQASLAKKLKLKLWEGDALDNIGFELQYLKNYAGSLEAYSEGLRILNDSESEKNIWRIGVFSEKNDSRIARLILLGSIHHDLANLFAAIGNFHDALLNYNEAIDIANSINGNSLLSNTYQNLGHTYIQLGRLDSAEIFEQKAIYYSNISDFKKYEGNISLNLGIIYLKKGKYDLSKKYFNESILASQRLDNISNLARAYVQMGNLVSIMGNSDSSLWYARKGLEISQLTNLPEVLDSSYFILSRIYKLRNESDSAFFYQSLAMAINDSIKSVEKIKLFENVGFDQKFKVQELEKEKIENENKIRTYSLLAGLGALTIIAFIIYRNNRQKQKANKVLEDTLKDLKSTQSQLIQSEKMASLGELTAGIAHEIQNPLNFVNNFSEVSTELVVEMNEEIEKGNLDEAKHIANDLKDNLTKINHHGKRAGEIVRSMLQHSRSSSSVKEPTDINALADEYLRLSYHGLRAKDKSFNATMVTDFDQSIEKVNMVPQDIGRVILNLFTNAFYVVDEKKKKGIPNYEPTISVKTKISGNNILISIKDNGNGIPKNILDKIFQPFFTTKPTGQGTGLGLSLSYDIIKAHGGELKVETKEGEGSEFIIQIPLV